jgi:diketogulonate reductase-like aldo/keto reductase
MSSIFGRLALDGPHVKAASKLPAFIYGTAWKKEATTDLVYHALSNGFTAIDTAAQPKHYREDLVAAGVEKAMKDGKLRRTDLYLQTKFTSIHGQDPKRMPYDSNAPLPEQVNASIMSSLRNFTFSSDSQQPYIDTLVLHSPMPTIAETLEVWESMEQYVPGEVRNLGISNCNLFTLMDLYERARIKPAVVQNRFYADTKFDIGVRKFCQEKKIVYQSFWTLSANPGLLRSPEVKDVAEKLNISPEAALYCLVLGLENIVILNGTTNPDNMRADWEAVESARAFAQSSPDAWQDLIVSFMKRIGQLKG